MRRIWWAWLFGAVLLGCTTTNPVVPPPPPGPEPVPTAQVTWDQYLTVDTTWTETRILGEFGQPYKRSVVDGDRVFVYAATSAAGTAIYVEFAFDAAGSVKRKTPL